MTEKEKMLSGQYFSVYDEELIRDCRRSRDLQYEFNALPYGEKERSREILRKLFGQIGSHFTVLSPFHCDFGYNIFIGERFFANYNCVILDAGRITIGDNVLFGPNVSLFSVGHPLDPVERATGVEFGQPITIGNNVWIGGGAIINAGVTIGDNTVIGSGSVVTKNIESGVLAAGNPCRVIRRLTKEDRIDKDLI